MADGIGDPPPVRSALLVSPPEEKQLPSPIIKETTINEAGPPLVESDKDSLKYSDEQGIEILNSHEHVILDKSTPNPVTCDLTKNPQSKWSQRLKASLRNLEKSAIPEYRENGIPLVKASASVILGGSMMWSGFLVAKFRGKPPPPSKVFSDLNPIWGKFGDIEIRYFTETAYLIFIPKKSTRDWVLQIGFWQSGNCSLTVKEWSPDGSFFQEELESIPTWVVLSRIPLQLYTNAGISLIASGIGEPLHSEHSRLNPIFRGEAKIKVAIPLDREVPDEVEIEDIHGHSVFVKASYPRLPPCCDLCSNYGHLRNRCLSLSVKEVPKAKKFPTLDH